MKKAFVEECNNYYRGSVFNSSIIYDAINNEIQYLFDRSYAVNISFSNGHIHFTVNKELPLWDVGVIRTFIPCSYLKESNTFTINPIEINNF